LVGNHDSSEDGFLACDSRQQIDTVVIHYGGTTLNPGTPVIINDFDRPCTRLVAIVTEVKDGIVTAKYLAKDTSILECSAPIGKVTPLHAFGKRLDVDNDAGLAWVNDIGVNQNRATYSDGRPRRWQEELHYVGGIKIRPEVAKLVSV
jgi:hypothetical protein